MKVCEAMTSEVKVLTSDQVIREAARMMADGDLGVVPIEQDDRLMGMVSEPGECLVTRDSAKIC